MREENYFDQCWCQFDEQNVTPSRNQQTVPLPRCSGGAAYLVFAVKQQQVSEADRREGGLLHEEGELLEAFGGPGVHVHEGLVVQGHRVQLLRRTAQVKVLVHSGQSGPEPELYSENLHLKPV